MSDDSGLRMTFGEISAVVSVQDKASEKMLMIAGSAIKTGDSFKQMGAEVEKSNERAAESFSQLDRVATRMIERMAILYALHGVFNFVKDIFDAAEALDTMNKQSDISIQKLQDMQYAAQQTGIKFEGMFDAAMKFTSMLARGDKNVLQGITDLGLDPSSLRNMNADAQIDLVTTALSKQTDQVTRLGVEWELFRNDKLDPVLTRFQELAKIRKDSNIGMSDEEVKQLAQSKHDMENFDDVLKTVGASWLVAAQNKFKYFWELHAGVPSGPEAGSKSGTTQQEVDAALASFRKNPFFAPQETMADWRKAWEAEMKFEDEQFKSMFLNVGKSKDNPPPNIAQMRMLPPVTTESKEDRAMAAAVERETNDLVRIRIELERQADTAIKQEYESQIKLAEANDKLYANNYGAQERIRQIEALIQKEQILTSVTEAEISAESVNRKIREESLIRILALEREETTEREKLKRINNDLQILALQAEQAQNVRFGRTPNGEIPTFGGDLVNKANADIAAINVSDPSGAHGAADRIREVNARFVDDMNKLIDSGNLLDQTFKADTRSVGDHKNATDKATAATGSMADQMMKTITFIGTQIPDSIMNSVRGMSGVSRDAEVTRQLRYQGLLPAAGFAGGGDVVRGVPITVGEHGSETFVPSQSGTIFPSGSSIGGGGTVINMNGLLVSNDPGGRALLMQAINEAFDARIRQGRKLPAA